MRQLAARSTRPPHIIPDRDWFIRYTNDYLGLLNTATAGVARLRPEVVTGELQLDTEGQSQMLTHTTDPTPRQMWYSTEHDGHTVFKTLSFAVAMETGYTFNARAGKGTWYAHDYRSICIRAQGNGERLHFLYLAKPGFSGRPNSSGILAREGRYAADVPDTDGNYLGFWPLVAFQEEPNAPSSEIADRIAWEGEKQAYLTYGAYGVFAQMLWRMGREFCAAAGIAPPDAT